MQLLFKQTSSSTVSYQFFDIDDLQFIIISISRDTALEIGAPSTALYILYAQFRYPSSCSDVDGCKKLFQKRIESTIEEPKTLSMEVPLIDGQIIRFHSRLRSLIENYNEGEYESDVNSLGND